MTDTATTEPKTPESVTQAGYDASATRVPDAAVSTAGGDVSGSGEGAAVAASPLAEVVERWVQTHVYNSPLSEATAAYNHLRQVLPNLITMLEKGL